MNRLRTAAFAVSLMLLSPLGLAQEDPSVRIEQRIEEVKTRLELTDEQVEQMTPVLEESMQARQSIMARYGIDPENGGKPSKMGFKQLRAMRNEMNALRTDTLAELDNILTDKQLEEFKLMQEEQKAEMRARLRATQR